MIKLEETLITKYGKRQTTGDMPPLPCKIYWSQTQYYIKPF